MSTNSNIIICTPVVVDNDAVSNDVIGQYQTLTDLGYQVSIFCIGNEVSNADRYNFIEQRTLDVELRKKNNTLIYHHSIHWTLGQQIVEKAKCIKIMKYHNVTPSHFFEGINANYVGVTKNGRLQTALFVERRMFDLFVADSRYNGQELIELGINSKYLKIIPPFTKFKEFEEQHLNLDLIRQIDFNKIRVFFVGRFAPNKGITHLIEVMNEFIKNFGNEIELNIAGSVSSDLGIYQKKVNTLIAKYRLEKNINILGKVPFSDLYTYFATSDIFLLCSEHEGFCVPILESQNLGLPIIAYNSSAVKETLGDNQVCFDELDYLKFAVAIKHIAKDVEKKSYLIQKGKENIDRFNTASIREMYRLYFKNLLKKNERLYIAE